MPIWLLALMLAIIFEMVVPCSVPAAERSPIHLETNWLVHQKTAAQCVEAAKSAFRDNSYPDLIADNGPQGVYAGDEGKTFAIRCDRQNVAFVAAAYSPWPQLGDVNTQTISGALKRHLQ